MSEKIRKKTRRIRNKDEETNRSGKIGKDMNQIDTKGATGVDPKVKR
ncbi:hypothetical protein [Caldisalinibacter kiritimatiensis]|uniref:Uncharacterized protein n=1 Tax=Caldisalinibacter kiritimatiensis TaxID=1304284 RepID=R1AUG2_9FIRM|nr:hypothetical protein [Caldisalinibacter kiritimatiensis]EOD00292.1 hypothetical protein L21TH_1666 [Caldisalinibacter kiritimatiensis]